MNGRIKRGEQKPSLKFPKIGSIRCGLKVKNQNGKEVPKSVDYFIASGNYASYFDKAYGEKPNLLQVIFLDDEAGLVCDERLELRDTAGKLVASGDGIDFKVFNEKTEKYEAYSLNDYPDMLEKLTAKSGGKWKTTLTLRFLLPKISGIIGYWELTTSGEASSIPQIREVFDEVLEQKGFIKGILFDLHVEIHTSNKPGVKSRYPVLKLVPNHSKENRELMQNHFKIESNQTKELNG